MGLGDYLKPLISVGTAALGWYIGGPIGGAIGWGLGMGIGGALFPAEAERTAAQSVGPALQGTPTANLGAVVTVLKGSRKFAGNLIWYKFVEEVVNNNETEFNSWRDNYYCRVYGGTTAPTNQYWVTFAYGVCVGPAKVVRIYLGKNEYVLEELAAITNGSANYQMYRINIGEHVPAEMIGKTAEEALAMAKAAGVQPCLYPNITQHHGWQTAADAYIVADKGIDNVPPYTNLCYLVFNKFPVQSLSATAPPLAFEVRSMTESSDSAATETDVTPQAMTERIITDEFIGMGLDGATYLDAAAYLLSEDYALDNDLAYSFAYDQQRSVLDALQHVIQHHNGYITYADGLIAHNQMEIEGAEITWAETVSLSDSFTDNTTGTQWLKVD